MISDKPRVESGWIVHDPGDLSRNWEADRWKFHSTSSRMSHDFYSSPSRGHYSTPPSAFRNHSSFLGTPNSDASTSTYHHGHFTPRYYGRSQDYYGRTQLPNVSPLIIFLCEDRLKLDSQTSGKIGATTYFFFLLNFLRRSGCHAPPKRVSVTPWLNSSIHLEGLSLTLELSFSRVIIFMHFVTSLSFLSLTRSPACFCMLFGSVSASAFSQASLDALPTCCTLIDLSCKQPVDYAHVCYYLLIVLFMYLQFQEYGSSCTCICYISWMLMHFQRFLLWVVDLLKLNLVHLRLLWDANLLRLSLII